VRGETGTDLPPKTEGVSGRPGPAQGSWGYPQLEYGHHALNQQPQQLYLSPFGHLVLVGIQGNYSGTKYIWRWAKFILHSKSRPDV